MDGAAFPRKRRSYLVPNDLINDRPSRGRTRIRLEEKLDQLANTLLRGVVGGVGVGGALLSVVPLALLGAPLLIPASAAGCVGGVFMLARGFYRRRVEDREHELHLALESIVDVAEDSMQARARARELERAKAAIPKLRPAGAAEAAG